MRFHPESSAPHLHPAGAWEQIASREPQAHAERDAHGQITGLILQDAYGCKAGIERRAKGAHALEFERDHFCYFMRGRGIFRSETGEIVEAAAETAVHLKTSWRGQMEVMEALDASYMQCEGASGETRVLRDPLSAAPLKDWGLIPTMIEGNSRTAGILLSRDPDGHAESGLWTCTSGIWRCEVTRDEFCHFLDGRCVYTHESGERIEIAPDTLAFFPAGWRGRCEVRETIRKIYMIR